MLWPIRSIYKLISYGVWLLIHLYIGKKAMSLVMPTHPIDEINIFEKLGPVSFLAFDEADPTFQNYLAHLSES